MNKIKTACNKFVLSALILSVTCGMLSAKPKEKLRLVGADRLEQITRNGIAVKKLTGNVHFRKGEVNLKCKLAYWFEKDERADFYHNVYMTKEKQVLQADTLVYYAADEIIVADGNTSFNDGEVTLKALKLLRKY